jgi:hypothetical protein
MSGFETVGVALAVIPLIISAVEHYEDILGPITTYRKYSAVLKTFTTELNVQRDIFQNECVWILSPFTDAHDLEDMLKTPSHNLRRKLEADANVNECVRLCFGPSHSQIINILELIQKSLDEIYDETKYLPEGLTRPVCKQCFLHDSNLLSGG